MFDYSDLRRILVEAVIILALGVVVGLSINLGLIRDLIEGRAILPQRPPVTTETTDRFPEPVDLASVQRHLKNGHPLLDARISELYQQGHIAGAISFPLDETEQRLHELTQRFPLDQPLATYCNGYGCPDSYDLALLLLQAGYQRVLVFEGGYPEWRDAGLPVAKP